MLSVSLWFIPSEVIVALFLSNVGPRLASATLLVAVPRTLKDLAMLRVEVEREDDGRWIAEVVDLPGVLAYGQTRDEAIERAKALSLRVLADRLEHGEEVPEMGEVFAVQP